MGLAETRALEERYLMRTYKRGAVDFVRGEGCLLWDADGKEYLDFLAGISVCSLGHCHPAVVEAVTEQTERLMHVSNLFYTEPMARLAQRLSESSLGGRVFFCNSGTEAWEAALKLARAHAGLLRAEGKQIGTGFLAMDSSFHGRTMGSVATTHKEKYREPFAPVMPGVEFVRFNDVADLRAKFSSDICGICIEAVQGEGGVRPATKEFLAAARELCDSTGALLLADEIQSGMGRTGEWFAYQHYGIQPDIVTLAKPIANGLPMGALLCTDEAARAFSPGMHGTTFGGGPLACAVAIAVIDAIKQGNLLQHVREVGGYFKQKLEQLKARHDCIVDVRGLGLMLGVEIDSADVAKRAAAQMMEQRIIINRTSETVLRFLPPYILERAHVDAAVAALDQVLTGIASNNTAFAGQSPAGGHAHG